MRGLLNRVTHQSFSPPPHGGVRRKLSLNRPTSHRSITLPACFHLMEAKLIRNKDDVVSITGRKQVQAAKSESLTVNEKPLLLTRGHPVDATVGIVARAFVNNDRTGARFRFSRSKRRIVEQDPVWNQTVRVSPDAMADYVKSWFALGELLNTAAGEVIILTDELPRMSVNLWMQGRYIVKRAELFEIID